MKKNILLLGCVFIISIFIVSCKSNNIENEITITKDHLIENDISGMGTDYEIKNIKKGKYNINLYSKEFAKGKFVKEQKLYSTIFDSDKNINKYNISIYQEDKKIKILIGESEFNERKITNININEIFNQGSTGEIIIYLKISKI